MRSRMLGRVLMTAAIAIGAAVAASPTDADLARNVRHEVLMYPRYTLWDDISFRVDNHNVELFGAVSQPFKKQDIQRLVQSIPGVASVTNQIKVLPLSPFDDRLRLQVAHAIYGYPALSRYAMGAVPAIHIIVDNGHVTLTGAVNSESEKQIAGIRASGAGLSFGPVVNNLSVDQPAKGKKS